MITVYVWLPKLHDGHKLIGHASMLVSGHTYISWWPDETAGIGNYHPIRNRGYAGDVAGERSGPDHAIILEGLDEPTILDWWAHFGLVSDGQLIEGPLLPYNVLTQNCSTVVARGLREGGGDKYATWWYTTRKNLVWWPAEVRDYALSIRAGLAVK